LGGSRRARTASPRGTAKDRALLLLGVRWRSREELRRRLSSAGFDPEQISAALADLERAGLIDDARFAREVVREQAGRRLLGDRAIRSALRAKGVDPADTEEAVGQIGDERERALKLAGRHALRSANLSADAAYRRIVGMLLRRGYGNATAREAAGVALAGRLDPDVQAEADVDAAADEDA
jgi:regulatory protein